MLCTSEGIFIPLHPGTRSSCNSRFQLSQLAAEAVTPPIVSLMQKANEPARVSYNQFFKVPTTGHPSRTRLLSFNPLVYVAFAYTHGKSCCMTCTIHLQQLAYVAFAYTRDKASA